MLNSVSQLLARLEQLTSEAVAKAASAENMRAVLDLIQQRGALVAELQRLIGQGEAFTQAEYNRLRALHASYRQLNDGISQARQQIVTAIRTEAARRTYADCVHGMVKPRTSAHFEIA